MNAENTVIDLMDELAAIRDGLCIWCVLNKPHPEYSRCSHNECHNHNHEGQERFRIPAMATVKKEVA